jgi:hypothetical protein
MYYLHFNRENSDLNLSPDADPAGTRKIDMPASYIKMERTPGHLFYGSFEIERQDGLPPVC